MSTATSDLSPCLRNLLRATAQCQGTWNPASSKKEKKPTTSHLLNHHPTSCSTQGFCNQALTQASSRSHPSQPECSFSEGSYREDLDCHDRRQDYYMQLLGAVNALSDWILALYQGHLFTVPTNMKYAGYYLYILPSCSSCFRNKAVVHGECLSAPSSCSFAYP